MLLTLSQAAAQLDINGHPQACEQDATNYERTLGLLRRFDPEFQEPDSAQKRGPGLRMVQSQPFNQAGKSPGPTGALRQSVGGPYLQLDLLHQGCAAPAWWFWCGL